VSGFRERDFLKRIIEQLAQGLARALKLRREKKFEQARQALGELFDDLVGVPRALVDSMDAPSAAMLIGDAAKLRIWARLLSEEAALLEDEGRGAQATRSRALQALDEAIRRSSESDEDRALRAELNSALSAESRTPGQDSGSV
jgi:hypothetical protein